MKKLLTLLLISITLFGYAQKFQLTDHKGSIYSDGDTISATITEEDMPYEEYVVEIDVHNLTESALKVNTLRANIELADGISAFACFGVCPADNPLDMDWTLDPLSSEPYALHLVPNSNTGLCKFKIEFWSEPEATDKRTLYIEVLIEPLSVNELPNTNLSLSAYPNPASTNSKINIAYTLADKSDNNCLVIRNIVGAKVLNMHLNPHENSVAIDASTLKSGVYFYAIENKNQISIAKKLIVK